MSAVGCHVVIKPCDGRVIAGESQDRRRAAARVLHVCRAETLLVFHLVDSHLHLLLAADERRSLALARRLESSLRQLLRLPVPFGPAYPTPARSQAHLYRAFDYILRQQSRHGLDWDPYFDACSLPDLLGLRTCGAYTAAHVRRLLPRVGREQLLGHLGVAQLAADDGPLDLLLEATLAAAGLVDVHPIGACARAALVAAAAIARGRFTARELALVFRVSERTIERYRRRPADRQLEQAIRRQLALRAAGTPRQGCAEGRAAV